MSGSAQVALLVLAAGCLVAIAVEGRRRQVRVTYLLLWTVLAVAVIPVVAAPSILATLAQWLGVGYPPSLAFAVGLAVVFAVCVHFSREITRLEERSRVLAEEFALLRTETLRVAGDDHSAAADGAPAVAGDAPGEPADEAAPAAADQPVEAESAG